MYTQQMPRCHLISKASARTDDLRMSESSCLQKAVKQPEADKQALQGHNAKCTKGPAEMRQKKNAYYTKRESQPPGLSHAQRTELRDANARKSSFHTDTLYHTSEAVVATSAEACFVQITAAALYLVKFSVAFNKRWNKNLLFLPS